MKRRNYAVNGVLKMRIGIISDLHIDRYNNSEDNIPLYEEALINEVKDRNVELLLIAGDISNSYELTMDFIRTVAEESGTEIKFVPGNHDLWQKEITQDTEEVLKRYAEQPECLVERPYIVNEEWAIAGHTGWYDYTYASGEFSYNRLEKRAYYGGTWQDKHNIAWRYNDVEMSRQFSQTVRRDLEPLGNRKIILVTHIVTSKRFRVPMPHRLFDYYNAFIGTSDFDAICNDFPVHYSIMGHVHFRHSLTENGITYICPCLGYKREWRTDDIRTEIGNAFYVIEI